MSIERVGGIMKLILGIMMVGLSSYLCWADETVTTQTMIVQKTIGAVSVRHGVAEQWVEAKAGDVLRPHDTMKTGKGASAVIAMGGDSQPAPAKRRMLSLPGEVVIDMSDIRDLSQEELMLKLTMERVRSSSYQWKNDELNIPNATVLHGTDEGSQQQLHESNDGSGILELNGSRVLFDNGFYSTCALKTMEVLRRYPALGSVFENRLLVAEALEKANISGEALNEYVGISTMQDLDAQQRETVRTKIASLKKQSHQ
jgi:hypothetical protein